MYYSTDLKKFTVVQEGTFFPRDGILVPWDSFLALLETWDHSIEKKQQGHSSHNVSCHAYRMS